MSISIKKLYICNDISIVCTPHHKLNGIINPLYICIIVIYNGNSNACINVIIYVNSEI